MKLKKLIKIFLFFVFVFLVFHFLNKKEKIIINSTDINQFNHLDIIVTSGQSVQSKILNLMNFSLESFSHVGIVCKEKNDIFILHSTTDGTKNNGIRYDDLQNFIDLSNVNYYKILRNKNITKSFSAINKDIEKYKKLEIPFDYDFNNINKEQIYCSELVFDIYKNNEIITTYFDLKKPIHPKIFTKLKEFEIILTRDYSENDKNKKSP